MHLIRNKKFPNWYSWDFYEIKFDNEYNDAKTLRSVLMHLSDDSLQYFADYARLKDQNCYFEIKFVDDKTTLVFAHFSVKDLSYKRSSEIDFATACEAQVRNLNQYLGEKILDLPIKEIIWNRTGISILIDDNEVLNALGYEELNTKAPLELNSGDDVETWAEGLEDKYTNVEYLK